MSGRETWDGVGAEWAASRPHRTWRAHGDAVNRRLVAHWLPHGTGAVLKTDAFDEAFGVGVAPEIARRAARVWVIDLSLTTTREARDRCAGLKTAVADVRRLPFGEATFDAVVSLSTLDHFDRLTEIDAALREIVRILAPRGRLVLTLDNQANPFVRFRNRLPYSWLRRVRLVPYPVGVTLDGPGLSDALERSGFEVRATAVVLHCPRALATFIAGLVDRWGGARSRRAFLRAMSEFERLGKWPTSGRTGYFVAALGVKPDDGALGGGSD